MPMPAVTSFLRILPVAAILWLSAALTGCAVDSLTAPGTQTLLGYTSPDSRDDALAEQPGAGFVDDSIRIAIALPLSGPSAGAGQALLDAASLALFDAYDPRLSLHPYDTLGTPEGAARAVQLALSDGAQVILGPLFAESIRRAAPAARRAGVPLIGFSNNRSIAGAGIYLLSFMPDQEVRRVVRYATAQGYRNFAALIPDTPYGQMILKSLSDTLNESDASIVALEIYPRDSQEVFGPVRRLADYDTRRRAYLAEEAFLKALDDDLADEILKSIENLETFGEVTFDAVLVPEGGQLLRSLVPLLPFFEVDPANVRFLGTGLWDDRSLIHEPPLQGGWYAGVPVEASDAFQRRYRTLFGAEPPRIASLGYDAMSLVVTLARNEIRDDRFTAAAIESQNGFAGVDGSFRFLANGIAERNLAVIEIGKAGFRTLSPAPESFEK